MTPLPKYYLLVALAVAAGCSAGPQATEAQRNGVAIAFRSSETYDAMVSKGIFTIEGQCIVLTLPVARRHTPVFSGDITTNPNDADGKTTLPLNKEVAIGGSIMSSQLSEQMLSEEFRKRCPGPYFGVGPINLPKPRNPPVPPPSPKSERDAQ